MSYIRSIENVQFQRIFTKSRVTRRDPTKSEPLLPAVTGECSTEFKLSLKVSAGHEPK